MGTNSSQIREELSQVLSQNTLNDDRAAQQYSTRKVVTSTRRKQRQRRREQRPYDRKQCSPNSVWQHSNSFDDEVFNAILMEAYDLEMMTAKEKWEQEQLNELEGMIDAAF